MGRVRPFAESDISSVIDLNIRSFPRSASLPVEVQRFKFREICLNNPWDDGSIRSLVYEEDDGRIAGFLGIIPRHMVFDGGPITIATGQHMMVDRAALASLQLFKAFIGGVQEFTMADMSVDVTRKLFERLGGSTVLHQSIYWVYPLRPLTYAYSVIRKRNSESPSRHGTTHMTTYIDGLISRNRYNPFRVRKTDLMTEELTPELYLQHFQRFSGHFNLRPSYTADSLAWLFGVLGKEDRFGLFRRLAVTSPGGELLGWYLYHAAKGGRGEVLQICATKATVSFVLDHLLSDAFDCGCTELAGRLDPYFMKEFSDKRFLFAPGKDWMLIHSRRPEISSAVFRGDAFLTRLEGDLWFL